MGFKGSGGLVNMVIKCRNHVLLLTTKAIQCITLLTRPPDPVGIEHLECRETHLDRLSSLITLRFRVGRRILSPKLSQVSEGWARQPSERSAEKLG